MTRVTLEETAASPTPVKKRTIRKTASALIPVPGRKSGRKNHCSGSNRKAKDGCGQGSTRADAIANISPGNLKQSVSPEKGAEHPSHGNRAEGEFFFNVLSRDAQVQAIERRDRHDGHYDAHYYPAHMRQPSGLNLAIKVATFFSQGRLHIGIRSFTRQCFTFL